MLRQRPKYDVVSKFKVFRSLYDKIFIIFSGCLWICSTLWDIYNLQRYWLDYTAELYGCFFIFYMMIFSINPKLLPLKIYKSFSLITTIKGRGTLLILISSLFLADTHAFHKFCAIILFVGGLLYFVCEILVPTTKEELEQIESYYKNNNINNINNNKKNDREVKINNINVETNKNNSIIEKSNAILNDINLNNNINKDILVEEQISNNNMINEENEPKDKSNKEESQNKNDNKDILVEEEIVRKTDNPYEIPEDF